jgi:hypothetical protein
MDVQTTLNLIDTYMLDFVKILPCVVTGVNYNKTTCNVQPLVKTRYEDKQEYYAAYNDVPFMVYSALRGSARITIPLSVGDNVIVLFSDRDTANVLTSNGLQAQDSISYTLNGNFPIMAIPAFYTPPSAKPVDSDDVIIENGVTSIVVKPDGETHLLSSKKVYIDTANAEITGDTLIKGNLTVMQDIKTMKNIFADGEGEGSGNCYIKGVVTGLTDVVAGTISLKGHTHTGDSGGTTSPPN